jgi:rhodanese-related sulfurtransferase
MGSQEAWDFIQANADNPKFMLIDVRNITDRDEFGYIEGDTCIPWEGGFQAVINTKDKCGIYLLYCSSGRRSADAMEWMKTQGFFEVYSIDGGIYQWRAEGFPHII